jgi:hypothetical protein
MIRHVLAIVLHRAHPICINAIKDLHALVVAQQKQKDMLLASQI